MKAAFVLRDDTMPRTHFYQELLQAAIRNGRFSEGPLDAGTVLFPAEEPSPSLNWPRFGNFPAAFVRGSYSATELAKYSSYTARFCSIPGTKCVFNMSPGTELSLLMKDRPDVIATELNLLWQHRLCNARSISMPALAITPGDPHADQPRDVFASFRGFRSHPCRDSLRALHNGRDVICDVFENRPYAAGIDRSKDSYDQAYVDLLRRSLFAFVPRGDCNFSYRLLEVMSFGCIPVVLSDGWVLPFDHVIDWSEISLEFPEAEIPSVIHRLRTVSPRRVAAMQAAIREVYTQRFASMAAVTESLFQEIEHVMAG